MARSKWRYFFWLAAIYNLLAGLPPLLAPVASAASAGLPLPEGINIFNMQVLGALVCTYGVGYAMVALGRAGAAEIATLGALGKFTLCALLVWHMQTIAFPPALVWAAAGDFIFACLFVVFILRGPARA